MTTSTFTTTHTSDHDRARQAVVPAGAACTLVALAFSFWGAHDMPERLTELGLQVVAAGLLFGVVVPRGLRHESAGGRGIAIAVLGLLLVVPAFWSGLPVQLGVAAVLLGYAGRRASRGSVRAVASLLLGVLAVVAYLAIYASEILSALGVG